MQVEIWSDVVCPWCYIGKRRFEVALARFEHGDDIEVVWRSFELDPHAPRRRDGAYADRLAAKYRMSVPEAQATIDRIVETGRQNGVVMDFDRATPGNTFDAHRLLHLALQRGGPAAQGALKERLFTAAFSEGAAIGETDVLAHLAAEAGLDPDAVSAVLTGDAFAADVRADEQRAAALGINAVPFFVVAGAYGLAGAQPPDVMLQVLQEAWAETEPQLAPPETGDDAVPACGDDTCAVAP